MYLLVFSFRHSSATVAGSLLNCGEGTFPKVAEIHYAWKTAIGMRLVEQKRLGLSFAVSLFFLKCALSD